MQPVPLADIVRDPSYQVRTKTDSGTVRRYAFALAEGAKFPPVQLARINGALVLVDGFHRAAAHDMRGISRIPAIIRDATQSEAQWLAAEANLRHGLPLRVKELRTAFRAMIRARRHVTTDGRLASYRELAGQLGVPATTLWRWMQKDFPKIARKMGGNELAPKGNKEEREDPAGGFLSAALDALGAVRANARGVHDPEDRGRLIEATEATLRALRDGGEWHPPLPPDF